MVDRISTKQIYTAFHQNIFDNQSYLIEASNKINTGIKFKNNYDNPRASSLSLDFEGQILNNDLVLKNRSNVQTELELAENSLAQMKDNMDKVKELILTAANASTDPSALDILKTEIRSIGQALMQLGNAKSGENYIFAGKQSNFLLHTAEPQTGILTFNLLRGSGFGSGGLTSNNVADAGNLVDLPFYVIPRPVAIQQCAGQHVDRQDVDTAFQPAFFAKCHPFIDRNQRVVVALGQQPLQRRLAGIVNTTDPQCLDQPVNSV